MLIAHVLGDSRWWYKKQACRGFRVWKQAFFAAAIEVDLDAKKHTENATARELHDIF